MNKEFILKNIDEAIRLVTEQPPELLDLNSYCHPTDCGTIVCSAGLACTSQHFRDLGWSWRLFHGERTWVKVMDVDIDESSVLNDQFGPNAYEALFSGTYTSYFDLTCPEPKTDKNLALHRLREQRKIVEAL